MTAVELVSRTTGREQRSVLKAAVRASTSRREIAALASYVKANQQVAWMVLRHRYTSPAAWRAIARHSESAELVGTLLRLFEQRGAIARSLLAHFLKNPVRANRTAALRLAGRVRQTASWIDVMR